MFHPEYEYEVQNMLDSGVRIDEASSSKKWNAHRNSSTSYSITIHHLELSQSSNKLFLDSNIDDSDDNDSEFGGSHRHSFVSGSPNFIKNRMNSMNPALPDDYDAKTGGTGEIRRRIIAVKNGPGSSPCSTMTEENGHCYSVENGTGMMMRGNFSADSFFQPIIMCNND